MQGQLFTQDFLTRGVMETPPYQALSEAVFGAFKAALQSIFTGLDGASTINEAQTEALVINKVLVELGWGDDFMRCPSNFAFQRAALMPPWIADRHAR